MEILEPICRVCMSSTEISYYNIFEDLQQITSINIADEIFFVTNLEIKQSDTLTKSICLSCYNDLQIAVNFKESCYKSQKLFQSELIDNKTDIKFYDPDESSNSLQDDLIEEIKEIRTKIEKKLQTRKDSQFYDPEPNPDDDSNFFQDDFIEDIEEMETKTTKKPKKVTTKPKRSIIATSPQCEECGKICSSLCRLRDHKLVEHGGEKTEICKFCNKGFVLKYQLKRHLDIHLNKRQWKCDFGNCNRGFNDPTGLRSHRFICPERAVIEKPHKCEICNKTFPFPARLKDHMQMYHLGIKRFGCEECDKVFSRPFKLREHQRVHSGVKPYKCYYCDQLFRCQKHLKPHHNVHHSNFVYVGEGRKIEDI